MIWTCPPSAPSPDFYAASPQIAALQGALEQQTEALWTAENGLIDQLDVNKATWGLSCWEASLGLDVDVSRPDAYPVEKTVEHIVVKEHLGGEEVHPHVHLPLQEIDIVLPMGTFHVPLGIAGRADAQLLSALQASDVADELTGIVVVFPE